MKKQLLILATLLLSISTFAQKESEEEKGGFKWNNVFIGGSVALGFGSTNNGGSSFIIGANPEIGYSIAEWLDAGVAFNCISTTYKYTNFNNLRVKQTSFNYGGGIFTRIHPFNNFFIQLQPEYNWIDYKERFLDQPGEVKQTVHATSFLAGIGYGQRAVGHMNFFTVLMIDLGSEIFSPYRDNTGSVVPVIRGGINFYLGSKKKK